MSSDNEGEVNFSIESKRDDSVVDLIERIFLLIKAPDWHGYSINSLVDSMVWGEINELKPPYKISIKADPENLDVLEFAKALKSSVDRANEERRNSEGNFGMVTIEVTPT